jgi:hypothetical protein
MRLYIQSMTVRPSGVILDSSFTDTRHSIILGLLEPKLVMSPTPYWMAQIVSCYLERLQRDHTPSNLVRPVFYRTSYKLGLTVFVY